MRPIERELKSKGILRKPLDPDYLKLIGAIDADSRPAAGPTARQPWTETFHLFCCRGSWTQNFFTGALHLHAPNGVSPDGDWILKGKKMLHDGLNTNNSGALTGQPAVDRFDFEATYRKGELSTWKTRQAIVLHHGDHPGQEISSTVLIKTGSLSSTSLILQINAHKKMIPRPAGIPVRTLADCLIGCRLRPLDPDFSKEVCLLEEFSVLKSSGRLYCEPSADGMLTVVLQSRGSLPFEFWLNEDQRLIAALQGSFGTAWIPSALTRHTHSEFIQAELDREVTF